MAYKYAPGIINYSCAGHGGFHLASGRNAAVHPAWRTADGWYEEDSEWAVVAITFPEAFHPDKVSAAHGTAKTWFPHKYEEVTGTKVNPSESLVLREEIFYAEHAKDYLAVGASGDWADWVPKGKVGVTAVIGGHKNPGGEERRFLVDEERYDARQGTYVVDPELDEALD